MMRLGYVVISLLLMTGCASLVEERSVGVDGVACVGCIDAPVAGLQPAANEALVKPVQLPSGKGGTCSAQVYTVTEPVVLYRVFDGSKPYTKFGGWWALSEPSGSRDQYRNAYAICPEWSALDRVVACEVRPGSQVVIGTTQSATCADGTTLPKTAFNQVYVPNNGKVGIVHVGACRDEASWPQ